MKIETSELIIRDFELSDENDLCEYMLQRVNSEFEQYPDFTVEKSKEEIEFRVKSEDRKSTRLNSSHIEDLSLHDALPIFNELIQNLNNIQILL